MRKLCLKLRSTRHAQVVRVLTRVFIDSIPVWIVLPVYYLAHLAVIEAKFAADAGRLCPTLRPGSIREDVAHQLFVLGFHRVINLRLGRFVSDWARRVMVTPFLLVVVGQTFPRVVRLAFELVVISKQFLGRRFVNWLKPQNCHLIVLVKFPLLDHVAQPKRFSNSWFVQLLSFFFLFLFPFNL